MWKKKLAFAVAALCCLAAVTVVVWIYSGSPAGNQPVHAEDTKELLFWYEDSAYTGFFENAAAAWQERTGQPVRVEYRSAAEFAEEGDYIGDVYDASMAGEEFPDVWMLSGDRLEEAYLYGLAADNTNPESLLGCGENALAACTYKDRVFGYPLTFHALVFVYQNGYFEKIPSSLQEVIEFSNENEPPEHVEYLLEWAVGDPFFDFPFISNSVTFEKSESEVMTIRYDNALYNRDLEYFAEILQSFSVEADTISEQSVVDDFVEGKTLCAMIDVADLHYLQNTDCTVMLIPDLNEELSARTCASTELLLVNDFSDRPETAAEFAAFVTTEYAADLREQTGTYPLALREGLAKNVSEMEKIATAAYESAVLMPDSEDARDFWVTLGETFVEIHKNSK